MRMEFDDAVLALDDLHLGTRNIEPVARTDAARQREEASRLNRDELAAASHAMQNNSITAPLQMFSVAAAQRATRSGVRLRVPQALETARHAVGATR